MKKAWHEGIQNINKEIMKTKHTYLRIEYNKNINKQPTEDECLRIIGNFDFYSEIGAL